MIEVIKKEERNTGIDLLRLLAMLMVVILHVLGFGGILNNSKFLSINYEIGWLLEIISYCAVNCYALISGYVGINYNFKYSRIIELWLRVIFYNLVITGIFFIIDPSLISKVDIFKIFFPVLTNEYWYFTTYFCMFFFIPFLNFLINKLNKKMSTKLIITIILLFSITTMISDKDIFGISYGYSVIWLTLLYLIGAYIKKYDILKKWSKLKLLLGFSFCAIFTWLSKFIIEIVYLKCFNQVHQGMYFVRYNSITILFEAIFLLVLFSKIKIKKEKRFIQYIGGLAFSIYIIHLNQFILDSMFKGKFVEYIKLSPFMFVIAVITSSIFICIVCLIIDMLRNYIFKKIKIKEFSNYIVNKINDFILLYNK